MMDTTGFIEDYIDWIRFAPGIKDISIQPEMIRPMQDKGLIVDGQKGGLVLGRSHESRGGIPLLHLGVKGDLVLSGLMEGFEYVLPPEVTKQNLVELTRINGTKSENRQSFKPYHPPSNVNLIDATEMEFRNRKVSRIIFLGYAGQMIVNRHATKLHLKRLFEINQMAKY